MYAIRSYYVTFLIFPTMLMLLPKRVPSNCHLHSSFTTVLARFTEKNGSLIMAISAFLLVGSIVGSFMLIVENSFIDYFRDSTEIYQGMKVIDEQLGGTTPLDVIIDFPPEETPSYNFV